MGISPRSLAWLALIIAAVTVALLGMAGTITSIDLSEEALWTQQNATQGTVHSPKQQDDTTLLQQSSPSASPSTAPSDLDIMTEEQSTSASPSTAAPSDLSSYLLPVLGPDNYTAVIDIMRNQSLPSTRPTASSPTPFLKRCAWQTAATAVSSDNPIYAQLGALYTAATAQGSSVGPLVGGAALCLYRQGVFCKGDSDIDLAGGDPPHHSTPPQLRALVPKTTPKISFDHTDYSHYGKCECLLPGNHRFLCIKHVRRLAEVRYGASWWVPNLATKTSLIDGSEKRPFWMDPWIRSIRKYDANHNDIIEPGEIAALLPVSRPEIDITRAAAEMTLVLGRKWKGATEFKMEYQQGEAGTLGRERDRFARKLKTVQ